MASLCHDLTSIMFSITIFYRPPSFYAAACLVLDIPVISRVTLSRLGVLAPSGEKQSSMARSSPHIPCQ